VGVSHLASPEVLRHLAKEAHEKTEARLRSSLTPIKGGDPGRGAKGAEKSDARPETGVKASKYKPGAIVEQGGQKYRFKGGDDSDTKNYTLVL
jgi:hypothetical protein